MHRPHFNLQLSDGHSPNPIKVWGTEAEAAAAAIFKKYWGKRKLGVRVVEVLLRPLAWLLKSRPTSGLDEIATILVFEPGSLGDMVMLMPFLRSLRARFPKARLSLLCRVGGSRGGYASLDLSSVETLLVDQGYVDELIPVAVPWLVDVSPWKKYNPFSMNWPRFVYNLLRLRRKRFDLAFPSSRSDIRYNLVLWLTGAKRRVGYAYAGGGFLLTDIATPDMARPQQAEVCLQLLESLGIPVIREGELLRIPAEDELFSAGFLNEHGIGDGDFIVGIHAGSRVASRTWGQENFRRIAERLSREFGAKVIWFGHPADSDRDVRTAEMITASFPLHRFLALLARCSLLICNDSGPMHMAGGLGVPVVAVFGSTFPEWFLPSGDTHRAVVRRDMPCRPCGDRCILDQPYCLRLISVEQVMETVTEATKSFFPIYGGAEAQK